MGDNTCELPLITFMYMIFCSQLSLYDSVEDDAQPLTIPAGLITGHEDTQPEEGMIQSSTKMIPKEDPDPGNSDVTAANLLPDTPHPIEDAFK